MICTFFAVVFHVGFSFYTTALQNYVEICNAHFDKQNTQTDYWLASASLSLRVVYQAYGMCVQTVITN